MQKLTIIGNVYNAFKALHSASDIVSFARNNEDAMTIVATVLKMQEADDGSE